MVCLKVQFSLRFMGQITSRILYFDIYKQAKNIKKEFSTYKLVMSLIRSMIQHLSNCLIIYNNVIFGLYYHSSLICTRILQLENKPTLSLYHYIIIQIINIHYITKQSTFNILQDYKHHGRCKFRYINKIQPRQSRLLISNTS